MKKTMEIDRRWNFIFVNLTLKIQIDGIEFGKWQFSTFFAPKLHNISTENNLSPIKTNDECLLSNFAHTPALSHTNI